MTWVDKTGTYGDVEYSANHKSDCLRDIASETETDMAGWLFAEKTIFLGGVEWTPLKARGNVGPCLNCGRLVVGIPLILFIAEGKGGELDFCFKCAVKLGFLAQLLKGKP